MTSYFQKNCRRNSGGSPLLVPIRPFFFIILHRLKDFNRYVKNAEVSDKFPLFSTTA
jgi:hypothetical protein